MRNHFISIALVCAGCANPNGPAGNSTLPRPADVATVDGLMKAFYEVVNVGPEGPRQWDRDRTLYSPWIRFVALGASPSGRAEVAIWTQQQLVDATEPLLRSGFREREIHRTMRRYGRMVHVDSTYETELSGKRSRGVNSLELYFDGARWWMASAMWQSEDRDHPLPAELLPAGPPEFSGEWGSRENP
jgi:hypothetical protein